MRILVSEEQDNEDQPVTEEEKYPGVEKLRKRLKWIFTSDYRPTVEEKADIFAQFGLYSEPLLLQSRLSTLVDSFLEYNEYFSKRIKELEASQPMLAEQIDPLRQETDEARQFLTEAKELAHTMIEEFPQEFYSIPEFKKSIREEMQLLERQLTGRIASIERHIPRIWYGIIAIPTIIGVVLGLVLYSSS